MERYPADSPIGGAPIYFLPSTGSTMTVAREFVDSGAPSGVVVLTDFQSSGRGRLPGRKWLSEPGESLMFTVAMEIADPVAMPLRVGLSVALALESVHGLRPAIKWPNDVLVSGRKICGVLCEYSSPWLFAGVGVNLMQREFPPELATSATSVLRELGSRPDRDRLLLAILAELSGPQEEWRGQVVERLWRSGERVEVRLPDGDTLSGFVDDIDEDGALVIMASGARVRIVAGELSVPGGSNRGRVDG